MLRVSREAGARGMHALSPAALSPGCLPAINAADGRAAASARSGRQSLPGMPRHCLPGNSARMAGHCCNRCNGRALTGRERSPDFARPSRSSKSPWPTPASLLPPARPAATGCRTPGRRWQSRRRRNGGRSAWRRLYQLRFSRFSMRAGAVVCQVVFLRLCEK